MQLTEKRSSFQTRNNIINTNDNPVTGETGTTRVLVQIKLSKEVKQGKKQSVQQKCECLEVCESVLADDCKRQVMFLFLFLALTKQTPHTP